MSLLEQQNMHPNALLDLRTIGRLPEPEKPRLLKDVEIVSLADRIAAALKRDNYIYIDFDYAVRMMATQREVIAWAMCVVVSPFISGQLIDDKIVESIRGAMKDVFAELCELETAPGVFPDQILAACAELRLRSEQEKSPCEG